MFFFGPTKDFGGDEARLRREKYSPLERIPVFGHIMLSMSTLKLPDEASQTLGRAFGHDLDRAALEALAIEGYRSAKLSVGEVAHVLRLETSLTAQKWLTEHGVEPNYSLDDLLTDREDLLKLFPDIDR